MMNDEWSENEWSEDDDHYDNDFEYEIYNSKQTYYKNYNEIMYIHTIDPIIKHNIFVIVEKIFKDEILSYKDEYINSINICYSVQNKKDIIKIGDRIQEIFPYNMLGNYDLYLTLIFIYYSLLGEPGEEIFTGTFFIKYAFNEILVTNLYFMLTTDDLIEHNGNNLSKYVRKYFLGMS